MPDGSEAIPRAISPSQLAPPRIVMVSLRRALIRFSRATLAAVCSKLVVQPTIL